MQSKNNFIKGCFEANNTQNVNVVAFSEIHELVEAYKNGDLSLENNIAIACQPYVRGMVRKVVNRQSQPLQRADIEDLWQAGNVGLVEALEAFDLNHSSGASFTTFAKMWIHNEVYDCLRKKRHIVTIPDSTHDELSRITKVLNRPDAKKLSDQQIAKEAKLTFKRYKVLKSTEASKCQLAMSTDRSIKDSEGEDSFYGQELPGGICPEEEIMLAHYNRETEHLLSTLLDTLDAQSRGVISELYGLCDRDSVKVPELAERLNVSPDEIRNVKQRALKKMKKFATKNGSILPKKSEFDLLD